jgi:predicted O-methyltransferase YrrM
MNIIQSQKTQATLERLFALTQAQEEAPSNAPEDFSTMSAQERADAMSEVYMPVSRSGGDLLYALARASRAHNIVEFGTSYGISTIFLAAAVADSGHGHVYTTEMSAKKIEAARGHLIETGLDRYVTILAGDARETLRSIEGPIGLVLLDGWKDLCLPILKLIEPKLVPGALVVGDDSSFASMADYVAYVRDPAHGYVSVAFPIEDGMEISCKLS